MTQSAIAGRRRARTAQGSSQRVRNANGHVHEHGAVIADRIDECRQRRYYGSRSSRMRRTRFTADTYSVATMLGS